VLGALHVSTETDKAVVSRFFEQAINQRHYDVIDEVVASDFVLHSALLGEVHGGDAYKQSVLGLLNPCPDFHTTVEDLIGAEGDTVVTRLTYRGTDTGGFVKGHAATGKPFELARSTSGACRTASWPSCGKKPIESG
jgi:predicted ester cyclase